MLDDYSKDETNSEKIRKENSKLLDKFTAWLKNKGLSKKTISKHVDNIDFYINEFLLYEDANDANSGVNRVNYFLGFWFIKKTMWASVSQIKSNASSLQKFYTFMFENGEIEKEDLEILKSTIKEELPEWIATIKRYDDPSIDDMEEVWGI